MRLPFRVIESFEDATVNFERIESVFSGPQAEPLAYLQLKSAQDLRIDHGSGTVTFPGATTGSNIVAVSHGLGRTPVFAIAGANGSGGGGLQVFPWFALTSSSTTQLNFRGNSLVQEPAGATAGFFWLALG